MRPLYLPRSIVEDLDLPVPATSWLPFTDWALLDRRWLRRQLRRVAPRLNRAQRTVYRGLAARCGVRWGYYVK